MGYGGRAGDLQRSQGAVGDPASAATRRGPPAGKTIGRYSQSKAPPWRCGGGAQWAAAGCGKLQRSASDPIVGASPYKKRRDRRGGNLEAG